ncbi:MAG: hypothetical protein ACREQL_05415, partial [Candidatus Binatia bacterium]
MTRIAFAPLLATGGTQRHLQQVLGLLDAINPERLAARPVAVNAEPYALQDGVAFRYSADDEQR